MFFHGNHQKDRETGVGVLYILSTLLLSSLTWLTHIAHILRQQPEESLMEVVLETDPMTLSRVWLWRWNCKHIEFLWHAPFPLGWWRLFMRRICFFAACTILNIIFVFRWVGRLACMHLQETSSEKSSGNCLSPLAAVWRSKHWQALSSIHWGCRIISPHSCIPALSIIWDTVGPREGPPH